MSTIIIGGGPTGLGAAWRLKDLGFNDWLLFEKNPYIGGLSASFLDAAGFTWDVGGHVLFSHYPYFDQVVEQALRGEYFQHQRESWVRIQGTWVPYPFQNNIRHLPEHALDECLAGLRELEGNPKSAKNFRQWMDGVFGCGIVKYFMDPYNRKVWGTALEHMSKEWIGERVSVIDLDRIEQNIAERRDDVNWGPNNLFKFPHRGGTGAIFNGISEPLKGGLKLNHSVVGIELDQKRVLFQNGESVFYDNLISTMPLDQLISVCQGVPEEIRNATAGLVHNSGLVVGLGVECHRNDSKCWMYFPEDNCPFYRVTNFHNYSPAHVPGSAIDRYCALMCETTYSPTKSVDKDRIIAETIDGLVATGLLSSLERERICSRYLIDIPYSYPIPTLGRDAALAVIQPFLESKGVYSRGRFGAWKYEVGNMDHSFMQGVEVVEWILQGIKERTVKGHV